MEIKKQNYRCRCGVNNCGNYADYRITDTGVMPCREINICKECAAELAAKFGKIFGIGNDRAVSNGKRDNKDFGKR